MLSEIRMGPEGLGKLKFWVVPLVVLRMRFPLVNKMHCHRKQDVEQGLPKCARRWGAIPFKRTANASHSRSKLLNAVYVQKPRRKSGKSSRPKPNVKCTPVRAWREAVDFRMDSGKKGEPSQGCVLQFCALYCTKNG